MAPRKDTKRPTRWMPEIRGERMGTRLKTRLLGWGVGGRGPSAPPISVGRLIEAAPDSADPTSRRRAKSRVAPVPCTLDSARCFVEGVAREYGLNEEQTFGLKVAVSEACANALEHGHTTSEDLRVSAAPTRKCLTVSVTADGPFRPPVASERRENRGMGVPLMIALTDEFAVSRSPNGGMVVSLGIRRR